MLFDCRVAREVLNLSLLNTSPQLNPQHTTLHLLQTLLDQLQHGLIDTLPFYLGWRIWKMHNKAVYENKRDHIIQVIMEEMMEKRLWEEAQSQNPNNNIHQTATEQVQVTLPLNSLSHILPQCTYYFCVVDASWKSPEEKAGRRKSWNKVVLSEHRRHS